MGQGLGVRGRGGSRGRVGVEVGVGVRGWGRVRGSVEVGVRSGVFSSAGFCTRKCG